MATKFKHRKGAEVMGDDGSMTLSGHLRELRNRIVICAVIYIVAAVGFLAIADQLIDFLTAMADGVYNFISIDPQEKLIQYFRVALLAALVVTIPFIAYHVYAFAKPGLKKSESFFFGLVLVMGLGLFVGVLFAYFISLPFMLNFMGTLAGADYIVQTTSIASYISFCITIFLIFGAVFEMPLVVIILARMGIVSPQLMNKARGVMIVLIFFVAAVITPARYRLPDHGGSAHVPAVCHQHGAVQDLLQEAPGRRGRGGRRSGRGRLILRACIPEKSPADGRCKPLSAGFLCLNFSQPTGPPSSLNQTPSAD